MAVCFLPNLNCPLNIQETWSCENKLYTQDLLSWENDNNANLIICSSITYMNLNRYQANTLSSVNSPQGAFNMDFWFYSQSYVSTTTSSNFGQMEVTWDRHSKIIIKNISNTLNVSCYPVIDMNNPTNDPNPLTIALTTQVNNTWTYISCGVDSISKILFLTTIPFTISSTSFTSINTIPSSPVNLKIVEGSTDNYGHTYITNLRLWNCYSCNGASIYL